MCKKTGFDREWTRWNSRRPSLILWISLLNISNIRRRCKFILIVCALITQLFLNSVLDDEDHYAEEVDAPSEAYEGQSYAETEQ